MSRAAQEAVIQAHCRELKLPAVLRQYPTIARQARDGGVPYESFLCDLLEAEVCARRDGAAARRLREARFPDAKTLDQIDWDALKGIFRPKLLELASCEYIDRGDDVVLAGPIGTGKTHVAIALGVEAARRRHRVAFARAADLVRGLLEARDERTLGRMHNRYQRVALLIVDELGFVPFDRAGHSPRRSAARALPPLPRAGHLRLDRDRARRRRRPRALATGAARHQARRPGGQARGRSRPPSPVTPLPAARRRPAIPAIVVPS